MTPDPAPGESLERSRDEVLRAARPLPEDMTIKDLTDDEERVFIETILDA